MKVTLKAARTNVGLTQQEAADKIGVTVDTMSNWERAKSFPNALQIRRIEEVYGVPYDNLIFLPSNLRQYITTPERTQRKEGTP